MLLLSAGENGFFIVCSLLPGDLLEQIVPHPEYKLVSARSIPQIAESSFRYTTYQWPALLKRLRQMLIANAPMEEGE